MDAQGNNNGISSQGYVPGATQANPHVQNNNSTESTLNNPTASPLNNPTESPLNNKGEGVRAQVGQQGNKIRDLKVSQPAKDVITVEVKTLLELNGQGYVPGATQANPHVQKNNPTESPLNNPTASPLNNSTESPLNNKGEGVRAQVGQQGNKIL
ncbi:unnamed protein product [Allacma fusca]|uniref:WHEP-TRS domain-containing protein n=1 Tax=Allacma fusca TaxID=39272 RepID=A0A8J2PB15_9HEXA|nr:unnamed protein product [Allacma fusca]